MRASDKAHNGTYYVAWLVQVLKWSPKPITGEVLAERLRVHAANEWEIEWSPSTAGRRLREAVKAARRDGWPVVSLGGGFFLAHRAEDRAAAAERLRHRARDLMAEASRLERLGLPGEEVQRGLFGGVAT